MLLLKLTGVSGLMNGSEETMHENHPRRPRNGQHWEAMTKLRQRQWNEQRQALTICYNQSIIALYVGE